MKILKLLMCVHILAAISCEVMAEHDDFGSIYGTQTILPYNNTEEPEYRWVLASEVPTTSSGKLSMTYGIAYNNGEPDTLFVPSGSRVQLFDLFFISKYYPLGIEKRVSPFLGVGLGYYELKIVTPTEDDATDCFSTFFEIGCDYTESRTINRRFYPLTVGGIAIRITRRSRITFEYWHDYHKGPDSLDISTRKVLLGLHLSM